MTKGLLLRVGIDSCYDTGGDLGPVFADGRFEYIPVAGWDEAKTETYAEHECRSANLEFGLHWSDFLKKELANWKIHHDPIFNGSWTYGECPTDLNKRRKNCKPTPKMPALESLVEDDLLVFTAGLKKWPAVRGDHRHVFIIGYLRVQESIPFYKLDDTETARFKKEYADQLDKNAHVIEQEQMPEKKSLISSVIVVGKDRPKSLLLDCALRISETGKDRIGRPLRIVGKKVLGFDGKIRNWTNILGFQGSVQRSTPRWIRPEHIGKLEKELGILRH
jgi:hypothetical protein